jgi:hypothetical protein
MNGVYTLTDSDVGPWQQEVLNYKFDVFPAYSNMTMKLLGSRLTMWIKTTFDPTSGFGASIGESTHAKKYNLGAMQSVTVQEVANRIASLEGGGIWIMRSSAPVPQRASDMEIEILPYWEEYDHDLNNFNEHELSNMICKP